MKPLYLLCVCLLLALSGCAVMPADPLAYQNGDAALVLSGTIDGFSFCAELTLSAVTESGIDARDFTLKYTAPASMAGLTLTRVGGETTLTRGGVVLDDPDGRFSAMTLPAALFCIDCELGDAAVVRQNGTTLNRLEAADDEGRYLLWLDDEGFPCRIEGRMDNRMTAVDILRTARGEENKS